MDLNSQLLLIIEQQQQELSNALQTLQLSFDKIQQQTQYIEELVTYCENLKQINEQQEKKIQVIEKQLNHVLTPEFWQRYLQRLDQNFSPILTTYSERWAAQCNTGFIDSLIQQQLNQHLPQAIQQHVDQQIHSLLTQLQQEQKRTAALANTLSSLIATISDRSSNNDWIHSQDIQHLSQTLHHLNQNQVQIQFQ